MSTLNVFKKMGIDLEFDQDDIIVKGKKALGTKAEDKIKAGDANG